MTGISYTLCNQKQHLQEINRTLEIIQNIPNLLTPPFLGHPVLFDLGEDIHNGTMPNLTLCLERPTCTTELIEKLLLVIMFSFDNILHNI